MSSFGSIQKHFQQIMKDVCLYSSNYSRSSAKGPPREFRKVVATKAGRLREWALVSDHVIKQ